MFDSYSSKFFKTFNNKLLPISANLSSNDGWNSSLPIEHSWIANMSPMSKLLKKLHTFKVNKNLIKKVEY